MLAESPATYAPLVAMIWLLWIVAAVAACALVAWLARRLASVPYFTAGAAVALALVLLSGAGRR